MEILSIESPAAICFTRCKVRRTMIELNDDALEDNCGCDSLMSIRFPSTTAGLQPIYVASRPCLTRASEEQNSGFYSWRSSSFL